MIVRSQRGYVYKVGKGKRASFHIRFYQTELVEGKSKRVQRSVRLCPADGLHYSTTCKAVQDLAAKHMLKINADSGVVTAEDMKIVDYWDQKFLPYCETGYEGHGMKPTTVRVYKQVFDSVLRAHFGDLRLRQYTPAMARAFLSSMKTTRTETNLRNIRAVASSIFTEAIDANLLEGIELNPWHIKLPTAMKAGATKVYTREEAENIISALVDHVECQLVMALSCFTGLRHGEIRGLQWGDIDKEWIHIRRQVDDLGNITTPKTTSSVGKVPLLDAVRVPLGLWRKKSADGKMLWVLSKTDRPINLKNLINRVIKPTLEAAQGCALESGDTHLASTLKWKTMHAGRRGAGAMAIAAGNPKLGQMLLRHDKLTTTLKAYDDVMPESDFLAQMQVVHAKQLKS